jgi:hypothetical protein
MLLPFVQKGSPTIEHEYPHAHSARGSAPCRRYRFMLSHVEATANAGAGGGEWWWFARPRPLLDDESDRNFWSLLRIIPSPPRDADAEDALPVTAVDRAHCHRVVGRAVTGLLGIAAPWQEASSDRDHQVFVGLIVHTFFIAFSRRRRGSTN